MSALQPPLSDDSFRAEWDFLAWAWNTLGWPVSRSARGNRIVRLPPELHDQFGPQVQAEAPASATEKPDPKLLAATLRALQQLDEVVHAAPACQPTSVHQLTPRLFDAYTVEGGHVLLGGCSLDDYPLIRATQLKCSRNGSNGRRLEHTFTTPEGQIVDPQLLASLRVDRIVPVDRPPRVPPAQLESWLAAARRLQPEPHTNQPSTASLTTLIWCKYLRCKLIFEIGDAREDLPFTCWAQWLIDGQVSPPPFRCPRTQRESYHVVATDDGQVTVPEAVVVCEQTGRRVLETGVSVCEITHRRVLSELVQTCPVSGQRVLISEMARCNMCGQMVSPQAVFGELCQACQNPKRLHRGDTLLARVWGEYPALERWSRWRFAEIETAYILTARWLFRRLVVVLDKQTLEPIHLAERTWPSRRWSPIPQKHWQQILE